jgi:hypothetical protein
MPVKKYLELDSTYRNRNLYPICGDFIVNIAQGGQKNQLNAVDPVSDAYPIIIIYDLKFNFEFKLCLKNVLSDIPLPIISSSSGKTIIVNYSYDGDFIPGFFWTKENFFSGLTLINKSADATFLVRRILKSKYLTKLKTDNITNNYLQLEIDLPIPSDYVLNSSTTFNVLSPTTLNFFEYLIFLPASVPIKDYYKNYYIYNQTKNTYCLIQSFDDVTHVAKCINTQNLNWNIQTDQLSVIKTLPIYFGNGVSYTYPNSIDIGTVTNPNLINCFYYNCGGVFSEARIKKIVGIIGITKDNNFTTVLDLMVSYTKFIIVENIIGISFDAVSNQFQILPYSYDNAVNFSYSGSMTSLTQPCAYEVKLNSISLPNVVLDSGGFIWNYPFIYIELENVSTSSNSSNNVIYSNNPFATKTVFKIPLINITNPEQYQYLNYTGNDMTQTLVIKPNSDFHIVVKLPNGEIFSPADENFNVGQPPNALLQLNAVFSFEKV